jgi:hypothetical protein
MVGVEFRCPVSELPVRCCRSGRLRRCSNRVPGLQQASSCCSGHSCGHMGANNLHYGMGRRSSDGRRSAGAAPGARRPTPDARRPTPDARRPTPGHPRTTRRCTLAPGACMSPKQSCGFVAAAPEASSIFPKPYLQSAATYCNASMIWGWGRVGSRICAHAAPQFKICEVIFVIDIFGGVKRGWGSLR